ncbi:hypothetical protein LSH36_171g00009 [Paralvinella palmiformis]|uniref:Nucleotide-diphospho-sugar transferase domain-containing protein n=1 Tax=Paralvinella palmiformis TaxID=53620 RepID=A0AAD9N7K6_9ANNE|nr:hypothetical protein LSH36_171g00009 [Paralvinella palmiformis]
MKKAKAPSIYNSRDYNIKACFKPRIILKCLNTGLDVLLVDLDIVFLKNPLSYFQYCQDCDLITQYDSAGKQINSGFFLLGNVFFTQGHRIFIGDKPCNEYVLVHNNYIVSLEAKIYRFKEYGLWVVDEHCYYSDSDRKYIIYDNPIQFNHNETYKGFDTKKMELVSLKAAFVIGRILNRTVILPKFHCQGANGYKPLTGQVYTSVRKFESYLPVLTTYREHVFLKHPLVPKMIKESKPEPFLIYDPL